MEFLLELMGLLVLMSCFWTESRRLHRSPGVFKEVRLPERPAAQWRKAPSASRDEGRPEKATQLQVSGRVDAATLRMMRNPRCGEEDPFRFHTYRVLGQVLAHADAPEGSLRQRRGLDGGQELGVQPEDCGRHLGLGHSQHYSAVMGPVYSGYRVHFKLHPDDIQAHMVISKIREAGEAPSSQKESFGTGGRSGPLRFPCGCCDDFGPQQKTFVFRVGFVWTVSSSGSTPPRLTSDLWTELPGGLSVAVTSQRSGKTYFLKENRVWRSSGFKLDHGFPRKLSNIPANIDAAFYQQETHLHQRLRILAVG
ncbi:hypothetical protein CesoFtcFv8_011998 [Champsocephalus esox]|uniref:Uncharacterized protein n=1 Tax=Champsocephalus esox TaxID=159716 RepID=A0AAN8H0Z9_9TELE|nr:hypothetical protein CesoFtcFv8_011998 [Champsocephalus esox]